MNHTCPSTNNHLMYTLSDCQQWPKLDSNEPTIKWYPPLSHVGAVRHAKAWFQATERQWNLSFASPYSSTTRKGQIFGGNSVVYICHRGGCGPMNNISWLGNIYGRGMTRMSLGLSRRLVIFQCSCNLAGIRIWWSPSIGLLWSETEGKIKWQWLVIKLQYCSGRPGKDVFSNRKPSQNSPGIGDPPCSFHAQSCPLRAWTLPLSALTNINLFASWKPACHTMIWELCLLRWENLSLGRFLSLPSQPMFIIMAQRSPLSPFNHSTILKNDRYILWSHGDGVTE